MFLLLQERQVGDKLPATRKCDNLSRFENAHFLVPACGIFRKKFSRAESGAEDRRLGIRNSPR